MSAAVRVLVLGATGDQGAAQVEAAQAAGFEVAAAARDPARAGALLPAGTVLRAVDFNDAASLARAVQDIDVLFANFPSSSFNDGATLERQAAAVAAAARAAGTPLVLFNTSMPLRARANGHPSHDVRVAMVDAFVAAAVPLIVFNPVVFMGNLLRGWARPGIVERGVLEYPHAPDLDVSWVCQEDLAALMVAAASRPHLAGRRYAIGGPQALRGADVAAALTRALGRPIRFVSQSVADFCAAIAPQVRHPDPATGARLLEDLGRIYRWYNESPERPFSVDMRATLAELPVTLTPLEDWARRQRWQR
jgi:uncharacterized protein YbjT (DUF2867 family)